MEKSKNATINTVIPINYYLKNEINKIEIKNYEELNYLKDSLINLLKEKYKKSFSLFH